MAGSNRNGLAWTAAISNAAGAAADCAKSGRRRRGRSVTLASARIFIFVIRTTLDGRMMSLGTRATLDLPYEYFYRVIARPR
jgi:hypothetical protein